MKNDAQKNMLSLAVAGLVLIVLNVMVLMGTKNGQLAPVDNLMLWGTFVVLNVCSLLWAVSLLGLQPMVVAFSYVAGGVVAFQGVRLLPEVNVAEVTTAGATYGAFGVLAIGNATTKVRLAFFSKRQVPFIFILGALLLMDGFLNSRVSSAGWGVIVNALVFPFMLAGVMVGLVWMLLSRFGIGQGATQETAVEAVSESPLEETMEESAQLMIKIPDGTEAEEEPEELAMEASEAVSGPAFEAMEVAEEPVEPEPLEAEPINENEFFPLEIDKGEEMILMQEEDQSLMDVATQIAEIAPEPVKATETIYEEDEILVEEAPAEEVEAAAELEVATEPEEVTAESEEGKADSDSQDWLSGHLDLLNNLKKAS